MWTEVRLIPCSIVLSFRWQMNQIAFTVLARIKFLRIKFLHAVWDIRGGVFILNTDLHESMHALAVADWEKLAHPGWCIDLTPLSFEAEVVRRNVLPQEEGQYEMW